MPFFESPEIRAFFFAANGSGEVNHFRIFSKTMLIIHTNRASIYIYIYQFPSKVIDIVALKRYEVDYADIRI